MYLVLGSGCNKTAASFSLIKGQFHCLRSMANLYQLKSVITLSCVVWPEDVCVGLRVVLIVGDFCSFCCIQNPHLCVSSFPQRALACLNLQPHYTSPHNSIVRSGPFRKLLELAVGSPDYELDGRNAKLTTNLKAYHKNQEAGTSPLLEASEDRRDARRSAHSCGR